MRKFIVLAILLVGALVVSTGTAKADHWTNYGGYRYYVSAGSYFWQDAYGQWFVYDGFSWRPAASPLYVPYYAPFRPFYQPSPYYRYRYWRDYEHHHHHDGHKKHHEHDKDTPKEKPKT